MTYVVAQQAALKYWSHRVGVGTLFGCPLQGMEMLKYCLICCAFSEQGAVATEPTAKAENCLF